MKTCGRLNVRKDIYIKGSDRYDTLDTSLKFDSLNKIKIKSSESKDILGRSRRGVDYLSGSQGRNTTTKKARYANINVSKKYLSNIIREFEKLSYGSSERERPKHDPLDSYFYPAIHLAK